MCTCHVLSSFERKQNLKSLCFDSIMLVFPSQDGYISVGFKIFMITNYMCTLMHTHIAKEASWLRVLDPGTTLWVDLFL